MLNRLSLGIENRAFGHNPDVCFHAVSIALRLAASRFAVLGGRKESVLESHFH
jgi:hypothetical protein